MPSFLLPSSSNRPSRVVAFVAATCANAADSAVITQQVTLGGGGKDDVPAQLQAHHVVTKGDRQHTGGKRSGSRRKILFF